MDKRKSLSQDEITVRHNHGVNPRINWDGDNEPHISDDFNDWYDVFADLDD